MQPEEDGGEKRDHPVVRDKETQAVHVKSGKQENQDSDQMVPQRVGAPESVVEGMHEGFQGRVHPFFARRLIMRAEKLREVTEVLDQRPVYDKAEIVNNEVMRQAVAVSDKS